MALQTNWISVRQCERCSAVFSIKLPVVLIEVEYFNSDNSCVVRYKNGSIELKWLLVKAKWIPHELINK